jgi:hypothetical protein
MNTKMLMLGILLIAGLSFAAYPVECRWAYAVTDRYLCSVVNAFEGNNGDITSYGYYTLAEELAADDPRYATYLENMFGYLGANRLVPSTMRNGVYNMRQNVCVEDGTTYVPPAFRSGMLEYNTNAALFKREFNSLLRLYLANNPTDRSDVLKYLSDIRADYTDCVSPHSVVS